MKGAGAELMSKLQGAFKNKMNCPNMKSIDVELGVCLEKLELFYGKNGKKGGKLDNMPIIFDKLKELD